MAVELSQVDELLKDPANQEAGQEGMPTPEQVIAAEEERVRLEREGTPPPEQKPPAKEGEEEEAPKGTERIDTLLKKAEGGEELSDDEKAEIILLKAEIEGAEPPPKPEKTYTIAGKVFTFDEVEKEMRGKWLGELDVSAERLEAMVDGYARQQNREKFHVETQKQSEVNAAERNALLQAKILREEGLRQRKAELERIRRDKEYERARAAVEIDPAKVQGEDGRLDILELTKAQQKIDATQRLQRLDKDEVDTQAQILEDERTLVVAEVSALIALAPQYKLDLDVRTAFETMAKGGALSATDKLKVLELDQFVRDARSKGIPLEEEYAFQKARGTTAIKPTAQAVSPSKPRILPGLPTTSDGLTKMLRDLRKRQAAAPPSAGGGGGSPRHADNRSDARKLIDHDRAVLEGGEKDDFLETWKAGTHIRK